MANGESSEKFSISVPADQVALMDVHRGDMGRSAFITQLIRADNESRNAKGVVYDLVDEVLDLGVDVERVLRREARKVVA